MIIHFSCSFNCLTFLQGFTAPPPSVVLVGMKMSVRVFVIMSMVMIVFMFVMMVVFMMVLMFMNMFVFCTVFVIVFVLVSMFVFIGVLMIMGVMLVFMMRRRTPFPAMMSFCFNRIDIIEFFMIFIRFIII